MPATKELTIEEAEALAAKIEAKRQGAYEDYREACALSSRFRDASELDVVRMWKTGKNEKGKPLTKFEVRALGGALVRGLWMPTAW